MKLPKRQPIKCSGASYNFYPFLSSCSRLINQDCDGYNDSTNIQLILRCMPDDKRSAFLHIDDWKEFKNKLIDDFGHIEVFLRKVHKQFNQLDQPLQTIIKND